MLKWLKSRREIRAIKESRFEALKVLSDRPNRKHPSLRLVSAITQTATQLGPLLSHGGLRRHRGAIILILARQSADAGERLSSSYFNGPDGHNVGQDVFQAYSLAAGTVRVTAAAPRANLEDLLEAIVKQSAAYRARPGDPDGFGSATLGEIERDLRSLIAEAKVPAGRG
jgi:hypothetical protein